MLHSKYLILPNQFVNSCNSWKFEGFSCHLSFLYKGGYKQILGIEGNSSIATDMSVWDGVSAITRVLLKMVKVSESWSIYIVITLFRAQIRNNTPCIVAFGYVPQKAPHYSLYPPPAIILEPVVHWLDWGERRRKRANTQYTSWSCCCPSTLYLFNFGDHHCTLHSIRTAVRYTSGLKYLGLVKCSCCLSSVLMLYSAPWTRPDW